MKDKKVLIIGVLGQDGAYLSQLLLQKNYQVIGVGRSCQGDKLWRLQELNIAEEIKFVDGDIEDENFINGIIKGIQPDEIYNFASISFVGESWKKPKRVLEINTIGLLNILEAIRENSPN